MDEQCPSKKEYVVINEILGLNNDVEEYVKAEESKNELLSPYKCIYKIKLNCWNITNLSILQIQNQYFFLPIASGLTPHCPAYLPIYLQMEVKKNDDLLKELEDKLGHPRHFLDLDAPENDSKSTPDWLNINKHSKTASEGDVTAHSSNPAPTPLSALTIFKLNIKDKDTSILTIHFAILIVIIFTSLSTKLQIRRKAQSLEYINVCKFFSIVFFH